MTQVEETAVLFLLPHANFITNYGKRTYFERLRHVHENFSVSVADAFWHKFSGSRVGLSSLLRKGKLPQRAQSGSIWRFSRIPDPLMFYQKAAYSEFT
ncbi:hypothetical protein R1flu_005255 [Riccia fluitans]|uniref:Uncharacterized protein n=1 Tax=Riccia fluitans TaxID=41844 RepID=A0ABD1YSN7_9MARC